jgi:hypothetical protein
LNPSVRRGWLGNEEPEQEDPLGDWDRGQAKRA